MLLAYLHHYYPMTSTNQSGITPIMKQYMDMSDQYKDCLLFYRLGDFYELFLENAITAAKVLNIALTKRGKIGDQDIPMCGVPHHSAHHYIVRLVKEGFKIAICEQMETPEEAKKNRGYKATVRREVVRVITPGTIIEEELLEGENNNYLMCIYSNKNQISISWADISTGYFYFSNSSIESLESDIARISPRELLVQDIIIKNEVTRKIVQSNEEIILTSYPESFFNLERSQNNISSFYDMKLLDSIFDDKQHPHHTIACGAIVEYIRITHKDSQPRLRIPQEYGHKSFVVIDKTTKQGLEIEKTYEGKDHGSLIEAIDFTLTASGKRLFRHNLLYPLNNCESIEKRLSTVEIFLQNIDTRIEIRKLLKSSTDGERSMSRILSKKALPKDLHIIKQTLSTTLSLSSALENLCHEEPIEELFTALGTFGNLNQTLEYALSDNPNAALKEGGVIAYGFNAQLDNLKQIEHDSTDLITKLAKKYANDTGITSLKIKFNNIIGYFIEVTSQHSGKMGNFIHKQTLASCARYTTPELQELENKILNAKTSALSLEEEIFNELCSEIADQSEKIYISLHAISQIDLFTSIAELADKNKYCKPLIDDSNTFKIKQGRHPVIEKATKFVPNDADLSEGKNICLLTGPNMAGKSTFLRQNALITIMAHAGMFVPAEEAHIGLVDRIFSRIGASDNLYKGKSTFMVEMIETANITNNTTDKSLLIIDEIGRGTAVYDGLSIAMAVIEYISTKTKSRSIFATHYQEITDISDNFQNIVCHKMEVKHWNDKIIFLHKIMHGKSQESFGINVAKLAGMDQSIISRAKDIMKFLKRNLKDNSANKSNIAQQSLDIENADDNIHNEKLEYIEERVKSMDLDEITPKEAWKILENLQSYIKEDVTQ